MDAEKGIMAKVKLFWRNPMHSRREDREMTRKTSKRIEEVEERDGE